MQSDLSIRARLYLKQFENCLSPFSLWTASIMQLIACSGLGCGLSNLTLFLPYPRTLPRPCGIDGLINCLYSCLFRAAFGKWSLRNFPQFDDIALPIKLGGLAALLEPLFKASESF